MRFVLACIVLLSMVPVSAAPVAGAPPTADVGLVRDIRPAGGSNPRELTRAGGLVFFSADDGTHGRELWVTDGTERGTRLVRDIRRGSGGSEPRHLATVGSRVFFSAADGRHGRELWASDGTTAGTRLVADLTRGDRGSAINGIAAAGGRAYVVRGRRELWRSDGTASGTKLLATFPGATVADPVALGGSLYFSADGLWRTIGAGVRRLTPAGSQADQLARYRGGVYFRRTIDSGPYGLEPAPELWRSDGTVAGTRPFGRIADPCDHAVLDGLLFLNGRQSGSNRLYRSDGTAAGTLPVRPRVGPLWGLVAIAGRLWSVSESGGLWGEPDSLWASDGTSAGTRLVHGGGEDWFVSDWRGLDGAGLDGYLWFAAGPGEVVGEDDWQHTDQELWVTDGTVAGTFEAADIAPGGSSFPRGFIRLGERVLFSATDGAHGREVWSLALD